MKVAYITTYDLFDSTNWPKDNRGLFGASNNIAQALEKESIKIDYMGPLKKKKSPITRVKWLLYRHLLKQDYYSWAEPLILRAYAKQISKKISESANIDIVLCPENAIPIANLQPQQPMVLWTDTTIGSLVDYYPYLSNLCQETKQNLYKMEKFALENCQLVIMTSDWAAQKAREIYELEVDKVKVIPRGPNIKCERTIKDIKERIDLRCSMPCQLIFIGVDWFRKGGEIALEVAKELNRTGLPTELTVVGCQPVTVEDLPSFVKVMGFINISTASGREKFDRLLGSAHFLILPTKAEASAIVYIEANSWGVPSLGTKVGGNTTVIKDNLNGKTFSLSASISEYCNYIIDQMSNYEQYKQLAMSSFNEYQTRLNWSVAGKTAKKLFEEL